MLLAAAGFGSGLVPRAPGTWGSLLACLLYIPLSLLDARWCWLLLAVLLALGVPLCRRAALRQGERDPGWIVWDEMVAVWLLLHALPLEVPWLMLAVIVFRLFDIVKPWPVSVLDRRLKGGLGIMADDLVAAAMAGCLVMALAAGLSQ